MRDEGEFKLPPTNDCILAAFGNRATAASKLNMQSAPRIFDLDIHISFMKFGREEAWIVMPPIPRHLLA